MRNFLNDLVTSARALITMIILLGVAYPFAMYGVGSVCFPKEVHGSLIVRDDKIIGSELFSQKITKPGFFHARPSAGDFQTVASGASQFGATSKAQDDAIKSRLNEYPDLDLSAKGAGDLLTASGSGLDPDLSPEAAKLQVQRIIDERGWDHQHQEKIDHLIDRMTKSRTFGILGMPRINVLDLNLALKTLE